MEGAEVALGRAAARVRANCPGKAWSTAPLVAALTVDSLVVPYQFDASIRALAELLLTAEPLPDRLFTVDHGIGREVATAVKVGRA